MGSSAGFFTPALNFGGADFVPVPGDYDGDGRTDVAVFQTSTGHWFAVRSSLEIFTPAQKFAPGYILYQGNYDGYEKEMQPYIGSTGFFHCGAEFWWNGLRAGVAAVYDPKSDGLVVKRHGFRAVALIVYS